MKHRLRKPHLHPYDLLMVCMHPLVLARPNESIRTPQAPIPRSFALKSFWNALERPLSGIMCKMQPICKNSLPANLNSRQNKIMQCNAIISPLRTSGSSSTRRLHLTALSRPSIDCLIILIRSNLSRTLRRLVDRRRRIACMVRGRWRRKVAVLHAVAIWVLRLAVVWILLLAVGVGVHGRAVRVVVARARVALHHPAVVAEGWKVFARAQAGVPVAADEVGEEQEEEDGDNGVTDAGAGLGGWLLVLKGRGRLMVLIWFGVGCAYV